jgi:hypothetical protein
MLNTINEKMWFSLLIGLLLGLAVNIGSHIIINKYFINSKKEQ